MLSPRQLRRNALFHMLDGIFFFAALALFSREVVMPKMITDLSDRALLVGLVPLIYWSGYVLPQVLAAKRAEGIAYKKPAVIGCAVAQRVALLGFLVLMPALWGRPAVLAVFFCVLAVNSIGSGLIMPVWSDWYAKTTIEGQWARLLGLRMALFGVLALPLGWLNGWVMETFPAPDCYILLLDGALFFYLLSTLSLVEIQEEHTDGLPDHSRTSVAGYVWGLGRILVARRDFRLFVAASLLISAPIILLSTYLTPYGLTFPGVEDDVTGTFTTAYFVSMAAGSLVGGRMSDRVHAIAPFRIFPLGLAGAAACAFAARGAGMVTVAFCLLGLALGAQIAVTSPAIYRFAGPLRRPSYSALYFSLLGTSYALCPVLAGALLDRHVLSFPCMFAIAGSLALAGWLMFMLMRPPSPTAAA